MIDHWIYMDVAWLSPFPSGKKNQIQYLVAGILNDNDEVETEVARELHEQVSDLKMKKQKDTRKIMREVKRIKMSLYN